MIALSDAVLVVASATALATGLYRWQNNLEQNAAGNSSVVEAAVVQPASRQPVPEQQAEVISTLDSSSTPANVVVEESQITPAVVAETQQPAPSNELVVESSDSIEATTGELAIEAPEVVEPARTKVGTHTVEFGDTLNRIAYRYGTTVAIIREINNLEDTVITIGEDLYYPLPNE